MRVLILTIVMMFLSATVAGCKDDGVVKNAKSKSQQVRADNRYKLCYCNYECNTVLVNFQTKAENCNAVSEKKFFQIDNNHAKGYRCKVSRTKICLQPFHGIARSNGR